MQWSQKRYLLWSLKGKVTLVALTAVLVVAGVMSFSGYVGHRRFLSEMELQLITSDQTLFQVIMDKHLQGLQNRLSLVLRLEDIIIAFQDRDRETLDISAIPAYDLMHSQGNFSKLTFYVEPGVAFFRAHAPESFGDNVVRRRILVQDAFKEKKDVMGLEEEGESAYLFLAKPLYSEGDFLGVIEAGGDFQPVLEDVKRTLKSDVSMLLKKGGDSKVSGYEISKGLSLLGTTDMKLLDRMDEVVDFAEGFEEACRVTHDDGDLTLATTLFPLKDYVGKPIGVVAITSDITSYTSTLSQSLFRSMGIAFAGVVFAAALIFLTLSKSFQPLTRMVEIFKDLAEGEGDLTRRVQVRSHGEIKELADWMNAFIQNLQEMVTRIKGAMNAVSDSSRLISLNTGRVSSGIEDQNQSIQEISIAMDAMNQMNRQVTEDTNNLASHTQQASSSIAEMSASIDKVAEGTKESSTVVVETSSSITEMVTSINDISENINSLSSTAGQTASSTEEIDRSIREVEKNAMSSLEVSKEAVAKAETGMAAVNQSQEGTLKIKESFEVTSRAIHRLGEKSKEIEKILKVIDDVSDQTNLLSLNAAIIAAQAGDHGKGFAVVADEIKALAERSADSSKDIAVLVLKVQKETVDAIQSIEVSSSSISQGMSLSAQAGVALQKIMESVNHSSRMIEDISQATIKQSDESEMVNRSVEKITNSLRQVAECTQQQKGSSKQIMENTERFSEMVMNVSRAMFKQADASGQIRGSIEEINTKTQKISEFTERQTHKAEAVLLNSQKIEQIASQNSVQVLEMTTAIDEMGVFVKRLQDEIDKFKV